MKNNEWVFNDPKKTMVITTEKILTKQNDITYVSHDEEDGMWQFLDNDIVKSEDARIVSLEEIVTIDETVFQIASLPLGKVAFRKNIKDVWAIK